MRRFATGTVIAATALALALIACCHPAAAAESAPPVTTQASNPLLNPPVSDGYRLQVAIALRVINISGIDEVAQRFISIDSAIMRNMGVDSVTANHPWRE